MKRRARDSRQIALPFAKPPCPHRFRYESRGYVPSGQVCSRCGVLLFQYIPVSPDQCGYVTADWAWKYVHGNEWTTQIEE